MSFPDELTLIGLIVAFIHGLGLLTAVHAVQRARTSQGAIAWAISLVEFPYLTLPLYWVFGRDKFNGYVAARRVGDLEINHLARHLSQYVPEYGVSLEGEASGYRVLQNLAHMPFTKYNSAELLIDGEQTFDAIFAGIAAAEDYVLVQFFIVHDDELGRELKARLVQKVHEGVPVYFLFDEIGSHSLPRAYTDELKEAGVRIQPFKTTRGPRNRFQLNFRNHRKIVVVDGRIAYVGGHNVGDEYMGRDEKFGHWRDTHVKLSGPSVQCVQLAFVEDWYWATQQLPELNWQPAHAEGGDKKVLVLPSSPADDLETCGLYFVHAINAARHRLWIASPYFVPDMQVEYALQLAALRGVDVRIVLPEKPDHMLVYLAAFSYFDMLERAGVKFYRYQSGFLHHKVLVVDDEASSVGTANLDNRSFRLNFEITIVFADRDFTAEVADMLTKDFEHCRRVTSDELEKRSFLFKAAVRGARLASPVL